MRLILTTIILTMLAQPATAEDVFFCNGVNLVNIENGELTEYKNQNFKMLPSQSGIKIAGEGYLGGAEFTVDGWAGENLWSASNTGALIQFDEPVLNFAFVGFEKIIVISARCDKF